MTDQTKRLETLNNKDNCKSIYRKIFDKIAKERFDEIKKLAHEIDHDNLVHYIKNHTAKNV